MASRQDQGIYRRVTVRMWGDAKVMALSRPPPSGQVLWFHLLAGEQTDIIPGLCKIGEAAFAEQLGWTPEGFREAFGQVSRLGMAKADWDARVVWVPNAIKYNAPVSPNVVRSWADAWDRIPECALKLEAWQTLKGFLEGMSKGFLEAFAEACPKPSPKPFDIQEQDQDQDQEQDRAGLPAGPARARATRPAGSNGVPVSAQAPEVERLRVAMAETVGIAVADFPVSPARDASKRRAAESALQAHIQRLGFEATLEACRQVALEIAPLRGDRVASLAYFPGWLDSVQRRTAGG